jgi:hypothetical protein
MFGRYVQVTEYSKDIRDRLFDLVSHPHVP